MTSHEPERDRESGGCATFLLAVLFGIALLTIFLILVAQLPPPPPPIR